MPLTAVPPPFRGTFDDLVGSIMSQVAGRSSTLDLQFFLPPRINPLVDLARQNPRGLPTSALTASRSWLGTIVDGVLGWRVPEKWTTVSRS